MKNAKQGMDGVKRDPTKTGSSKKGGPTTEDRKSMGRNMSRVANQKVG